MDSSRKEAKDSSNVQQVSNMSVKGTLREGGYRCGGRESIAEKPANKTKEKAPALKRKKNVIVVDSSDDDDVGLAEM
eukprot:4729228-Pleurochrysis_carterae.AAC.1